MQGVDRIALFEPRAAQLGERPGGGRALGSVEVGKAISKIPREIELTAPLRENQSIGDSIWTVTRSEEHTSELQSRSDLVCRLLLEKKKRQKEVLRKET